MSSGMTNEYSGLVGVANECCAMRREVAGAACGERGGARGEKHSWLDEIRRSPLASEGLVARDPKAVSAYGATRDGITGANPLRYLWGGGGRVSCVLRTRHEAEGIGLYKALRITVYRIQLALIRLSFTVRTVISIIYKAGHL